MLHLATGSYWLGILGVVVHAALVYKLGAVLKDAPATIFGFGELQKSHTVHPHFLRPRGDCSLICYREKFRASIVFTLARRRCPETLRTVWRAGDCRLRDGAGDWCTGRLRHQSRSATGQKPRLVMLLMPRVIKPIMDGLTPIAKLARKRLQAKFGGQEFLIGLDPALLLGHTSGYCLREPDIHSARPS